MCKRVKISAHYHDKSFYFRRINKLDYNKTRRDEWTNHFLYVKFFEFRASNDQLALLSLRITFYNVGS